MENWGPLEFNSRGRGNPSLDLPKFGTAHVNMIPILELLYLYLSFYLQFFFFYLKWILLTNMLKNMYFLFIHLWFRYFLIYFSSVEGWWTFVGYWRKILKKIQLIFFSFCELLNLTGGWTTWPQLSGWLTSVLG